LPVIILAGQNYEIDRFNIGELKRMNDMVDKGALNGNVVERSRQLVEIALARRYPDLKVDDDLETTIAELNAAAATVIDVAGFVMVKPGEKTPAAG
jgi:hypothetical protein